MKHDSRRDGDSEARQKNEDRKITCKNSRILKLSALNTTLIKFNIRTNKKRI